MACILNLKVGYLGSKLKMTKDYITKNDFIKEN